MKKLSNGLLSAHALSLQSLVNKYYCFTIVRNPYLRLLSAYLDKLAAANEGQYQYVADTVDKTSIKQVSFADFVTFLERGGLYLNAHWAPQVSLLPIPLKMFAYVGYVETLDSDLFQILHQLNLGHGAEQVKTRQERRRHASKQFEEYYSAALEKRVYHLFERDFIELGYSQNLLASELLPGKFSRAD